MTIDSLKAIFYTIILLLAQAMVLNNVHLFGCCTPFLLVYALLVMPLSLPRWVPIVCGFVLGIVNDAFSNTPGVTAAALTLSAFLQSPLLRLFSSSDNADDASPSVRSMGFFSFAGYTVIMLLVFCVAFFLLEQFTFTNIRQLLLYVTGSTALSAVLIFTVESLRKG